MGIVNPIQLKAYDFSVLVERLKSKGLNMTEDMVKVLVHETFLWTKDAIVGSATFIDDLLLPLLPAAEAAALKEVDKLDAEVG